MEKLPLSKRPEPRIVGDADPEYKEVMSREIVDRFAGEGKSSLIQERIDHLKSVEREKTPEEKEAIHVANVVTNEILERFGLPAFDIPETNVYFIGTEEHFKELAGAGENPLMRGKIGWQIIFAQGNFEKKYGDAADVMMATCTFHEFVHLKAKLAFQLWNDGKAGGYRNGLNVHPNQNREHKNLPASGHWFDGLEEAIVAELEKEYAPEVLRRNIFLRSEGKWLESEEARKHKDELAKEADIPVDDIAWVRRNGEKFYRYTYFKQRQLLEYVADAICEDTDFASRREVIDLFAKAEFTGNLLEIGRYVEHAFGKGAFRELGMAGSERNDPTVQNALENLRQRREKMKK